MNLPIDTESLTTAFVMLWAVIDPIGTIPVFLSTTKTLDAKEKRKVALLSSGIAAGILLFFIAVGEILLNAMNVPLAAFQISGGIILFLFALSMIFGESKPEQELRSARPLTDTAVFPLATPSIASPGAIMAVVLLTKNSSNTLGEQIVTSLVMLVIIMITMLLMLGSKWISKYLGIAGASVISRVMGLILASIAATNVLSGLKDYFGH